MSDAIARAFSAPVGQDPLERRLVGAQLLVALAHRRQVLDDRVGHGLLERPVARPVERLFDLLGRDAADRGEDVDQVGDPGLVGAAQRPRSRSRSPPSGTS